MSEDLIKSMSFAALSCPCCFRPGVPFCSDPDESKITAAHKLTILRTLMIEHDIAAYVVGSEDNHSSEYVSPCDERRSFLSGFSGSAGTAIVTMNGAYLFTDSRYYQQAIKQLDSSCWELCKMEAKSLTMQELLRLKIGNNNSNNRVGVDPAIFSKTKAKEWTEYWTGGGKENDSSTSSPSPTLVPIKTNLVDMIWTNRPAIPQNEIYTHPLSLSGESISSKLTRIKEASKNVDALAISALDQIAWLFNLRGSDIVCNPVFYSYALISFRDETAHLFLGRREGITDLPDKLKSHLDEETREGCWSVAAIPYSNFADSIANPEILPSKSRLLVERGSISMAISDAIESAHCVLVETEAAGIVNQLKASKNSVEISNIIEESDRDSAAIVSFFAYLALALDNVDNTTTSAGDPLTESALAERLKTFRRASSSYLYDSFDCIAAVGSNASIIHYKPEAGSNLEKTLSKNEIFLLDSGGQYRGGTTDVTRTIHFGSPTSKERDFYTRVLQGHVAMASAKFPVGVSGVVLDAMARGPLWNVCADYGHGTGHGIGASLNVHEGPFGVGGSSRPADFIRKNAKYSAYFEPILAGYYMSDEPGYYEDGEFGIRIESDLITEHVVGHEKFLQFQYITKVPFCHALINVGMLTEKEKSWIDAYHRECKMALTPLLKDDSTTLKWLEGECREITCE